VSATEATLRRVALWLVVALAVLLVVLVATGSYLSTTYKPSVSQALDVPGLADDEPPVRVVHRLASTVFFVAATGLAGTTIALAALVGRRHRTSAVAGAAVMLVALGAGFSGYLLPWDQLALWAVTVGDDVYGVWFAAFDDQVRYVLVGSTEVEQSTYAAWTVVHVIVLPVLLAAAGAVVVRVLTAARRTRGPGAASPGAGDAAPTPDTPSTPAP
jgi:quinol-cytochrome oxidoreductase complex cytochrome b subunit